jgi:hypothetical protein
MNCGHEEKYFGTVSESFVKKYNLKTPACKVCAGIQVFAQYLMLTLLSKYNNEVLEPEIQAAFARLAETDSKQAGS